MITVNAICSCYWEEYHTLAREVICTLVADDQINYCHGKAHNYHKYYIAPTVFQLKVC